MTKPPVRAAGKETIKPPAKPEAQTGKERIMNGQNAISEALRESREKERSFAHQILALAKEGNLTWAEFERAVELVKEIARLN